MERKMKAHNSSAYDGSKPGFRNAHSLDIRKKKQQDATKAAQATVQAT